MNTGYGSTLTSVNKISDNVLEKNAISEYGKKRIDNEILFYQEIVNNKIKFPIPQLLSISNNKFTMEYLNNYITYQQYLEKGNAIETEQIFLDFKLLHTLEKKVSKDFFIENLKTETYIKVRERYQEISELVKRYSHIKKVNGIEILSLDYILNFIEEWINKYIESIDDYIYYPFHGDPQLNNILINEGTNKIKYIDPKGNFGKSNFYGMKEYDYAKFYFGLGGYSYFDLKEVKKLDIDEDNLTINIKSFQEYDFKEVNLINIFIISIWLGNAHCFKNNEFKAIESFYYSLYISTRLVKNI
jgi:hypothetical protein|uniref:Aminoglycoside phosphotransferase domain-containing protein n=1 Tax=viral metagenome TaxID=1070528 RepID=A0A6C0ITP6_9ZZZZ